MSLKSTSENKGLCMKSNYVGSLLSCLLLSAGLFSLPPLGINNVEGFFVTAWTVLGLLIAFAFLRSLRQKK